MVTVTGSSWNNAAKEYEVRITFYSAVLSSAVHKALTIAQQTMGRVSTASHDSFSQKD